MAIDVRRATAEAVELTRLTPGMQFLYAGNKLTTVSDELAAGFAPGDRLLIVQRTGEILHVPRKQWEIADSALDAAVSAFAAVTSASDSAFVDFYERFARTLEDDQVWARIVGANAEDVASARARGRSTTRLVADEKMRKAMADGLRGWADLPTPRGPIDTISRDGWRVEQHRAGYGVVGFVFEGRPNVLADASGVLRGGNTAVMRIGGDALGTARTILDVALRPALKASGLPEGAISLVESADHAAGWALFSNPRLGLAVARGSGPAVLLLGSLATQAGIPVSMHGTGGAWIIADESADLEELRLAVLNSTDRKVCNTVNTICLHGSRGSEQMAAVLEALEQRGASLGFAFKLHVARGSESTVPADLFRRTARLMRAEGEVDEVIAEPIAGDELGREWEWEQTPEVTIKVVHDLAEAIQLFNEQSPRLAASLISSRDEAHQHFFDAIDAPFVGNGFTRWVDGQYALGRPELGLSNWQYGRLLGRSAVLSGDSVFTVRLRAVQDDPGVHR
jgi:glutamate-5-semialdehyde dehydrogenase